MGLSSHPTASESDKTSEYVSTTAGHSIWNEVNTIWRCSCNTQGMLPTLLGSVFYNEWIPDHVPFVLWFERLYVWRSQRGEKFLIILKYMI